MTDYQKKAAAFRAKYKVNVDPRKAVQKSNNNKKANTNKNDGIVRERTRTNERGMTR